ncbi:MAG: sigma-70 family RNA polymerase sigma factor [Eubacteriales bacterium]
MSGSENEKMDFDSLYEEHKTMVYRLSLRYSSNDYELAEDATQFTFMQLYRTMERGTEINNIKSLLHTIVKNYTLNYVAKTKREVLNNTTEDEELTIVLAKDSVSVQEQSTEETYLEAVDERYNEWMVQGILDEMKERNERWYAIAIEVFYKQRGQLEVAEELGINSTTMYATIRRMRKWSKEHKIRFEEYAKDKTDKVPGGHLF